MKRILSGLLFAVLILSILPVTGTAAENAEEPIYYDDGSYMTVEVIENSARASGSKTGRKQYTYYNSDDVSQWKAVLTGNFTYTGSSATCTSSSIDVSIFDSSWYVVSKSASKNGNAATASVVIGEKMDGSTVAKISVNLRLECDEKGNLS